MSVVAAVQGALSRRRVETVFFAVPVAIAAAFAVLLVATFGSVVAAIYSDSDAVSLPVIGQLYSSAPKSAHVVVAFGGWYTGLWFELLTRWVPFYRQLWEVGPWVASLGGVALLVWAVARAGGRWAGAVVALVLVCAGSVLLPLQFEWAKHGASVVYVCVLGAFLLLLAEADGGMIGGRSRHVLVATAVTVLTAAGASSDSVFLSVTGLAPFVLAGLLLAVLRRGRASVTIGLTVVCVAVVAAVGARVAYAAMAAHQIRPVQFGIRFADWNQIGANVAYLAHSFAALFNADFGGASIDGRSLLAFACAIALGSGLVVIIRAARRWSSDVANELRVRVGSVSAARTVVVAFWLAVCLLNGVVVVFSSVAGAGTSRYLLPAAYGFVALVAVFAAGRSVAYRRVTVVGASVIALASVVSLAARDLRPTPGDQQFASELTTFAQGEGLTYGYADYWDAARLTWMLHGRVKIYPIEPCTSQHGFCEFPFHTISSWYQPQAGVRTFLIVDPRYGVNNPGLTLGGPDESITSGHYTVLVYHYDLASILGPAPPWRGT